MHSSSFANYRKVSLGNGFVRGTPLAAPQQAIVRKSAARNTVVVEANLFSRVVRIGKGFLNSVVSSAEDPEKILDQACEDMQEDLIKMRQASASVVASQRQVQAKLEQCRQQEQDWLRRAELALGKGEEDLAREALKRKQGFQKNADSLEDQLKQQSKAVDQLIGNTRALEAKLQEAKSKKETLKARAASAKTSKQIQEMVGSLDTSSAVSAFEKMEEKVMGLEAEADAVGMITAGDDLMKKFDDLKGDTVDAELQALKEKKPKGELPPGRPVKDAIDVELEQLRKRASS